MLLAQIMCDKAAAENTKFVCKKMYYCRSAAAALEDESSENGRPVLQFRKKYTKRNINRVSLTQLLQQSVVAEVRRAINPEIGRKGEMDG